MTAGFLAGALFVLLFLRVPIAIALGLSAILTMLLFAEQSLVALALIVEIPRRSVSLLEPSA